MKWKIVTVIGVPLLGASLLLGCQHEETPLFGSYEVTVTNLTESQPLSPIAVILHRSGYLPWQVGSSASDGLELLAEGGDSSKLLDEAKHHSKVKATAADSNVILPGSSSSVIVDAHRYSDLRFSVATMLVNTNDAFSGVAAHPINALALHESTSFNVMAYDAGTESNSESAATVPGPAAGGEGYNSDRDDRDSVGGHPGVVTFDDGLSGSALHAAHRFDNPVATVTVTRLK